VIEDAGLVPAYGAVRANALSSSGSDSRIWSVEAVTPPFQLILALSGGRERFVRLRPDQFNGWALSGPLGSLTLVMFSAAALRVFRHSNIVGAINTEQNVAVMQRHSERCPSASSGQGSYRTRTLPHGKLGRKFSPKENFGGGGSRTHRPAVYVTL
jgi:hypothetical protein